jgi:hypothetical protein
MNYQMKELMKTIEKRAFSNKIYLMFGDFKDPEF